MKWGTSKRRLLNSERAFDTSELTEDLRNPAFRGFRVANDAGSWKQEHDHEYAAGSNDILPVKYAW